MTIEPFKKCWCCGGVLVQKDHGKGFLWIHKYYSDIPNCQELRRAGATPGYKPPPPSPFPPPPTAA